MGAGRCQGGDKPRENRLLHGLDDWDGRETGGVQCVYLHWLHFKKYGAGHPYIGPKIKHWSFPFDETSPNFPYWFLT